MSTVLTQPTQGLDSASDVAVKTDLHTLAVIEYVDRDSEGKVKREALTDEDKANKLVEAGKAKILFHQTFSIAKAATVDGINQLSSNDENKVYFYNVGAVARQKNKAANRVLETDEEGNLSWEPTEQPYPMADVLNEDIQRRNLSDFEKAMKQIEKMPESVKRVIAEQLKAQLGL